MFIYSLNDPVSNEVKYIGATKDIGRRLITHMNAARLSNPKKTPIYEWIRQMIDSGKYPICCTIEECEYDIWEERERYWISYYRGIGVDLLNRTDGGRSPRGYIISEERRNQMRLSKLGKKVPEHIREKIRKTLSRPVICVETGHAFESMEHAYKQSGKPKTTFHRYLHNKKPIGGLTYKYI